MIKYIYTYILNTYFLYIILLPLSLKPTDLMILFEDSLFAEISVFFINLIFILLLDLVSSLPIFLFSHTIFVHSFPLISSPFLFSIQVHSIPLSIHVHAFFIIQHHSQLDYNLRETFSFCLMLGCIMAYVNGDQRIIN